jgi:hypothetical protein
MRVALLTVSAWTAISFLFTWLWGVAICRVTDPVEHHCNSDGYDPVTSSWSP